MKILLFGGSFDPPHLGHEKLLLAALRALRPDKAFLVPARRSPLKAGHAASPAERLRLLGILRDRLPAPLRRRVAVDRLELRRGGPSWTFETLRRFRSRYPSAELWFLLGSDSLASFPRWKRPSELRRACRWLVGRRPGARLPRRGLPPRRILPGLFPDVSSTGVRRRLLAGLDVRMLVPRGVLREIERRKLYGLGIHGDLKRSLAASRYEHTLAVARLALRLAERHGLDAESAAAAALLHDAGRRFDPAGMARYARLHRLRVPALRGILEHSPMLLHAFISEDLARRRFGVREPAVLSAVRNHTLGAVGMPELDRLLFVADACSEDRSFAEAPRMRRLAFRDLRAAFASAVELKLRHVRNSGHWLHPGGLRLARWARGL